VIEDVDRLVVPSICIQEVFRHALRHRGARLARESVGFMLKGAVVEHDASLAVIAGRLGHDHGLPLADSIVYATARIRDAVVWTQDADFEGLDGVRYREKRG